ncbi:hypothetical protein [Synechococcus sp. UW140]|uniref:hypothetical protein n=1 Tax=Synechococcus sp. UW140 TaxID=368503 RepID=UPI0010BD7950|nr:hypothetical protein [Synechococcus sp. UW140]
MPKTSTFLSFSGGGWNTHTASSAFIGAGLQAAKRGSASYNFDLLFKNIDGIGSISGGSWFTSMLSNSKGFADFLATRPDDWFAAGGYMGIQKKIFTEQVSSKDVAKAKKSIEDKFENLLFGTGRIAGKIEEAKSSWTGWAASWFVDLDKEIKDAIQSLINGVDPTELVPTGAFNAFKNINGEYIFDWLEFTKNTVYSAYGMRTSFEGQSLSGNRNDWSKDKDIILTTTYDASGALNYSTYSGSGKNRTYNNFLTGASNANIILPSQFVSSAKGANYSLNPFNELAASSLQFSVNSGSSKTSAFKAYYSSNLDIIESTAVSSAAAGILASTSTLQNLLKDNLQDYIRKDLNKDGWILTDNSLNRYLKNTLHEKLDSQYSWYNPKRKALKIGASNFVDIFIPTSKSSKAVTGVDGFIEEIVYTLQSNVLGLAIPLSHNTNSNTVDYLQPIENGSLNTLQQNGSYRFYDGGYSDNTGIAGVVSNIQNTKGLDNELDLTFFVNNYNTIGISKNLTGADTNQYIAGDAAHLFGISELDKWRDESQVRNKIDLDGYNAAGDIDIAFPYIFSKNAWKGKHNADWEWDNYEILLKPFLDEYNKIINPSKQQTSDFNKKKAQLEKEATYLAYYKLDIQTVDNPYWNIKKGQRGEANIFMSWKGDSFAAPKNNDFFDIYEDLYKATREGILNQGGYVHLLGALNVQNLVENTENTLKFKAEEGVVHKFEVNFLDSNSAKFGGDYMNVIEFYLTDLSGKRDYLGTVGGSETENGFSFENDVNPNLFYLEHGESLDFVYKNKSNETESNDRLIIEEYDANRYEIKIMDEAKNQQIASLLTTFVPFNSKADSLALDPTQRTSSDDTYFKINAGEKFSISLDAIAAMRNTIGLIQVDVDPITGNATFNGFATDSNEFDQAVRAALASNSAGFTTQVLNPGVTDKKVQWTASQDGYYAPAMITEKDRLFALNHTLDSTTHTRIVGEYTVAFEDMIGINQSDFDFNDAVFQLTPIV